ncbi:hypothetical protein [Rothia dentocariosa]|uniref:hypothetical protein n=1 Tax=Rothia dentocariosa TaxID=2047 RepID=UPI0011A62014|nr:hypothetical protein [Rothia dentocariosa]
MRTTKTVSKALTACAAISLSLGLGMGAANAIPPGGASENTPGTSSTVSPHVTPGGVVNFTLTGFPENTQVTVKLDDDGVVHRQTTDSKGNLNGSFVLSNAGSGDHTLRFLATGGGGGKDANGRNKGNTGGRYTNKSPVFTVGEPDNGGGNNGGTEDSNNNGSEDNRGNSAQDGGSSEQETVYLDADGNPISKEEYDRLNAEADEGGNKDSSDQKNDQNANKGEQKKTASASASSSAKSSASASSSAKTQADSHKTSNTTVTYGQEFPWLGVSVLGVAIIGAIAVLIIRKRP